MSDLVARTKWICSLLRGEHDLSTSEKLVMVALITRADSTDRCWPGQQRLADDVSLSRRQAGSVVRSLAAKGFIAITHAAGGSNTYAILHERLTAQPEPAAAEPTGSEAIADPVTAEGRQSLPGVRQSLPRGSAAVAAAGRQSLPTNQSREPIQETNPAIKVGVVRVELGTATCQVACELFVTCLSELGHSRGPIRVPWERESLVDAMNANICGKAVNVRVALADLRDAVCGWVAAYRDRPKFTQGWRADKFAQWLATASGPVAVMSPAHLPAPKNPLEMPPLPPLRAVGGNS